MKKVIVTGMALALVASAVYAAEEKDSIALKDEMIVTASRYEQNNEKIPGQVTVITAEDIQASGAQSVPDALKNLGGVVVSDLNGNGFNQTVDMGGFGETAGRHVAVLVNGRKMNPIDQSGVNFTSIPVENIEKIEVFHGGNSVLYGSDAMGGVINIITKEAGEGMHAWGEVGAGSEDTYKGIVGASFSSAKFGGKLGVAYYETDGYRDRSEADRFSANMQFTFDATDALSFAVAADTTKANYQFPGGLTLAQMSADREQAANPADEGENRENSYVFTVDSDWGQYGSFTLDLSYKDYERQDTMVSWNFPLWSSYGYYDYDASTIGVNPQYVLDRSLGGRENRLTLGIEYYDTDYDAWNGDTTAQTAINTYNHEQRTLGFYGQDELSLMENLVLNLGLRYEEYDTELRSSLGTNEDVDNDEWAWNVGIAYIFSPESKVYLRAYQAYRFPKIEDYLVLSSGAVNTDLTHERSLGYEAGVRFVGLEKRLVTDFRLFTFQVDDEISWNNASWQNENLDETRHQGGELNVSFKASELLTLYGALGYTDAEFTAGVNNGNDIPLVPEYKGNVGLSLDFSCGLNVRGQLNYLGKRYAGGDNTNTLDKLDSATTVDLYLSYPYEQLEFFLNATNIFNAEYYNGYNYGPGAESYYPMPEAVYYAGIRAKF